MIEIPFALGVVLEVKLSGTELEDLWSYIEAVHDEGYDIGHKMRDDSASREIEEAERRGYEEGHAHAENYLEDRMYEDARSAYDDGYSEGYGAGYEAGSEDL